jgi:hypothetical protein
MKQQLLLVALIEVQKLHRTLGNASTTLRPTLQQPGRRAGSNLPLRKAHSRFSDVSARWRETRV